MSVSESFLTFVLEQLEDVPRVSSRRMFGGVGIYSAERFFAIIDNDTLFFKADEATAARYKRRRMPAFRPLPDKPPSTGYFQVPPAVLEDRDALRAWAREAIDVAVRAAARPRKASKPRPA